MRALTVRVAINTEGEGTGRDIKGREAAIEGQVVDVAYTGFVKAGPGGLDCTHQEHPLWYTLDGVPCDDHGFWRGEKN